MTPDYVKLVMTSTREAFVSSCPFFFLLGNVRLTKPELPPRAEGFEAETRTALDPFTPSASEQSSRPLLLAVRKVQETFPSMITVGRTPNNDLVIQDTRVSRFHAMFRVFDDRIELSDAGSHQGTWVADRVLPQKGATAIVIPGDAVRFGPHEFTLLDAGSCWDRLHQGLAEPE